MRVRVVVVGLVFWQQQMKLSEVEKICCVYSKVYQAQGSISANQLRDDIKRFSHLKNRSMPGGGFSRAARLTLFLRYHLISLSLLHLYDCDEQHKERLPRLLLVGNLGNGTCGGNRNKDCTWHKDGRPKMVVTGSFQQIESVQKFPKWEHCLLLLKSWAKVRLVLIVWERPSKETLINLDSVPNFRRQPDTFKNLDIIIWIIKLS